MMSLHGSDGYGDGGDGGDGDGGDGDGGDGGDGGGGDGGGGPRNKTLLSPARCAVEQTAAVDTVQSSDIEEIGGL